MDIHESDTQQLLTSLTQALKQGKVSRTQILDILNKTIPDHKEKINLQKILYYLGGFILLLGIVFYVAQYWSTMTQVSRMVIVLGAAVATYSLGFYFYKYSRSKDLGQAFSIISVALFPVGIATALDLLNIPYSTSWGVSINAALLFIIYFSTYFAAGIEIFLPFSFVAASTFFFSFTNYLTLNNDPIPHFTEYRVLIIALSYILFGYYFSERKQRFMTNLLYFFGLGMALSATMVLQGFKDTANPFWETIYPLILVFLFYLSIQLQNKVFLLMATIFTFTEITKITTEYFSQSVGWPVSLMIAGLAMMGVGFMSYKVNKLYLKQGKL